MCRSGTENNENCGSIEFIDGLYVLFGEFCP
jgi:hypothetical protein